MPEFSPTSKVPSLTMLFFFPNCVIKLHFLSAVCIASTVIHLIKDFSSSPITTRPINGEVSSSPNIWAIFERNACRRSLWSSESQSISAFNVTRSVLGTAFWFSLISINSLICSCLSKSTNAITGMLSVLA